MATTMQDLYKSMLERTNNAAQGTLPSDPRLEKSLSDQKSMMENNLSQRLGSGYSLTTPGIQSMSAFNTQADSARYESRQGDLNRFESLANYGLGTEQLGLQAELGRGQLGLGQQQFGLSQELGRGQLALGQGDLAWQQEYGRGQIGLGQGRLDLDKMLGLGNLDIQQQAIDTGQYSAETGRMGVENQLTLGQGALTNQQTQMSNDLLVSMQGLGLQQQTIDNALNLGLQALELQGDMNTLTGEQIRNALILGLGELEIDQQAINTGQYNAESTRMYQQGQLILGEGSLTNEQTAMSNSLMLGLGKQRIDQQTIDDALFLGLRALDLEGDRNNLTSKQIDDALVLGLGRLGIDQQQVDDARYLGERSADTADAQQGTYQFMADTARDLGYASLEVQQMVAETGQYSAVTGRIGTVGQLANSAEANAINREIGQNNFSVSNDANAIQAAAVANNFTVQMEANGISNKSVDNIMTLGLRAAEVDDSKIQQGWQALGLTEAGQNQTYALGMRALEIETTRDANNFALGTEANANVRTRNANDFYIQNEANGINRTQVDNQMTLGLLRADVDQSMVDQGWRQLDLSKEQIDNVYNLGAEQNRIQLNEDNQNYSLGQQTIDLGSQRLTVDQARDLMNYNIAERNIAEQHQQAEGRLGLGYAEMEQTERFKVQDLLMQDRELTMQEGSSADRTALGWASIGIQQQAQNLAYDMGFGNLEMQGYQIDMNNFGLMAQLANQYDIKSLDTSTKLELLSMQGQQNSYTAANSASAQEASDKAAFWGNLLGIGGAALFNFGNKST